MEEQASVNEDWQRVLEGQKILQVGDVGNPVRALQERLNRAGYALDITGVFGPETQRAVLHFQAKFNIPPTGRMGGRTSRLLEDYDDTLWEHVKDAQVTLSIGDENLAVRILQERLCGLGLNLGITGVFGPSTQARVAEFQGACGLESTGTVDAATAFRLEGDSAPPQPETESSPRSREQPHRRANLEAPPEKREGHALSGATTKALDRMERAARAEGIAIHVLDRPPTGPSFEDPEGRHLNLDDGQNGRWLRRNARLFGFISASSDEPWRWRCVL